MKNLKLQWATIGVPVTVNSLVRAGSLEPTSNTQTMTDLDRVERCLNGDQGAFEELVRTYQQAIYRLCFRYAHRTEDAYDLAQDAFLKAYQGLHTFNRRSSFKTWLYRVAINNCINFAQRQKTHGEEVEVENAEDRSVQIQADMELNEELGKMRAALEQVPPRQQAALKLRVYQELTYEEIAKVLKCTVSTAKTNVFFGLANLRKIMKVEVMKVKS